MTETIVSLVCEAKRSKYSLIPQISEDDVLAIWDCLADFIERQMLQVKGVCIQGFGTFTFSQRKIEFSGNKVITVQRPVFVMAESFSQTHSLSYLKQHASGHIPVVSLNYTMLSNGTPYDRDTVEISIREILQALAKALVAYKNINLDFPKIGRLLFREKRARMKFFKEFVRSIDSSGNLEYAFRPSTCPGSEGSIISNPNNETLLPPMLPKITEASNDVCNSSLTSTTNSFAPSSSVTSSTPSFLDKVETKASKSSDNDVLYQDRPTTPHHMPQPATVVSISQPLSLVSSGGTRTPTTSSTSSQPRTCCHRSMSGQELCYLCHQRAVHNVPISLAEERRLREMLQDKLLQDFQQRREALMMANEKCKLMKNKEIANDVAHFNLIEAQRKKCNENGEHIRNNTFHPSYIFHHRSTTPCYTKKQLEYCEQLDEQVARRRKAMQKLKDQQEYYERQEQLQLSKELELIQESFATKMAEKKADYQRALDDQILLRCELHQLLHDKRHKQRLLNDQSPHKSTSKHSLNVHKTIICPFSQCESGSVFKSQSNKNMVHIKAAKVRTPSPVAQPVFGVHDTSPTKMQTQRQRAKLLYKEQLAAIAEKQQALKVEALRSKEEDAQILHHNLEDLWLNLKQSRQEHIEARKELETSWQDAINEKRKHRQKNNTQGPGLLLHDQCKKYLRCHQCQRRRDNVGTSNVLSESRYISGSRLMV